MWANKIVLISILFLVIAFVGFFSFRIFQVKDINSYEDCIKSSGSDLLYSYPPKCVTKDDRTFVKVVPKI